MKRKFFRKSDWIAAAIIIVLAVAGRLVFQSSLTGAKVEAIILVDGAEVMTVSLDDGTESTFTVPGTETITFYKDKSGGIRFQSSDCPDQVCVHTGRISTPGAFAACLPNKVLLQIVEAGTPDKSSPDIVLGG